MCGIAGILRFDGAPVSIGLIRRMTDLIAHRGPDDSGLHVEGAIGLGHRRLSILDLSPAGHQPMSDPTGQTWVVYNGECYNYRELIPALEARGHRFRSTSDTEPLLYLYQEHGPDFLHRIDGMFALAIWDAKRSRLLLARDRLGIKPLYYFADAQHVAFASEMKALLADPSTPVETDDQALSGFLHLMSVPGPNAILRGVRRVQPGHYLIVERGEVSEHAYWDVPVRARRRAASVSIEDAARGFEQRFSRAVSSHLVSDVPVGAFLSGGVDSTAVVAFAPKMGEPLETFSIAFPGLAEFDESPFAKRAADHLGTRHRDLRLSPDLISALPKVVWHADEPFAVSSSFALYWLAKLARAHVKVVLTGDGGDEVFAGYLWRHADTPRRPLRVGLRRAARILAWHALDRARRRSAVPRLDLQDYGDVVVRSALDRDRYARSCTVLDGPALRRLLLPERAAVLERVWLDNVVQRSWEAFPDASQLSRKLYTDLKTTLVSEMLTKVDRMTMAFGLEARVPFLDHRLVEWAFGLPDSVKIGEGGGKWVVRRALAGRVPADIVDRPKHGFNVPLKVWMRGALRDFVRDTLNERSLAARGLFRPDAVERMLREHEEGSRDLSNPIFILVMAELWYQQFVDQRHRYWRD